MSAAPHYSMSQVADALRAAWLGKKHHIEICRQPSAFVERRPAEWFAQQEAGLAALEIAGTEIAFLAKHEAEYLAWRAGVAGRKS